MKKTSLLYLTSTGYWVKIRSITLNLSPANAKALTRPDNSNLFLNPPDPNSLALHPQDAK